MIGLFCKRTLWKRLYSTKETHNLKEPTNWSHPILYEMAIQRNYTNELCVLYCIELHKYVQYWTTHMCCMKGLYSCTTQMGWAVCIDCIELHAYVLYWSTQICTVLNYIHVLYEMAIQLNYTNGLCVLTVTNYTHMYCIELLKHRYMHCTILNYGVATISKLLQNIRLCCRI